MLALPLDAAVSIVALATSWEIDVEILLFGITFFSARSSNSHQADIILVLVEKSTLKAFSERDLSFAGQAVWLVHL